MYQREARAAEMRERGVEAGAQPAGKKEFADARGSMRTRVRQFSANDDEREDARKTCPRQRYMVNTRYEKAVLLTMLRTTRVVINAAAQVRNMREVEGRKARGV